MPLSEPEKQAFRDDGVIVLRGLFRDDEVRAARAAFERLYATAQTLRATGDHDGAFFVLGAPPVGEVGEAGAAGAVGEVVVQRVVWAGGAEPDLLRLRRGDRRAVALARWRAPYAEAVPRQRGG